MLSFWLLTADQLIKTIAFLLLTLKVIMRMIQATETVGTDDNEALLIKLVLWQGNCLADYHF
jgi:hypothetical protein